MARGFLLGVAAAAAAAGCGRAQLLYPPALPPTYIGGSAYDQSVGDIQLRQAFDAAGSQALSDGGWFGVYGGVNGFVAAEACPGGTDTATAAPYPNYPPGAPAATPSARPPARHPGLQLSANGGVNLIDPTTAVPTGLHVDYLNVLMDRIGKAYNRRQAIRVTWTLLPSADACIDALLAGTGDVLPIHFLSSVYTTRATTYSRYAHTRPSTCLSVVHRQTFWVAPSSSLVTTDDLRAAMASGTPPKFGGTGAGTARAVAVLNVTARSYPTVQEATAGLVAGDYDGFTAVGNAPAPAGPGGGRMLAPGNPPGLRMETAASPFPPPLINGEDAAAYEFLPGNKTNVPQASSNSVALGDAQMQAAYLAAFNRVYASGTWTALLGSDPLLAPCDACIGPASAYPFPTTPSGVLAAILASGVVRMGFNTNLLAVSPSENITLINSGLNPPPGGAFYTLTEAIVAAIGSQYGKTLTIEWYGYLKSDSMMDQLLAGNLDMAPATLALGATYGGIGRGFRVDPSPCFTVGGYTPIWVAASSPYVNATQLRAALATNPTLRAATSGPANYQTAAKYILHATNVDSFVTPADAFDALIGNASASGSLVAVFDYMPTAAQLPSLRRLDPLSARAMSAVFRPPMLPAMPTPTPSATPTPVAELMQGGAVAGLAVSTVLLAIAMVAFGIVQCRASKRDNARRLSVQTWGSGRDGSTAAAAATTPTPAVAPPAGGGGGVALNPLNRATAAPLP